VLGRLYIYVPICISIHVTVFYIHCVIVLCTGDYSVNAVEGSKRVAGTLPTELAKLKNWKYVIFQNNGIAGTIPTEFGNLQSASAFWLSKLMEVFVLC